MVSAGGFASGAGGDRIKIACLPWMRAKNLATLYGATSDDAVLQQKSGSLPLGSQIEEFGEVMRNILPPKTLATWMNAPRGFSVGNWRCAPLGQGRPLMFK